MPWQAGLTVAQAAAQEAQSAAVQATQVQSWPLQCIPQAGGLLSRWELPSCCLTWG